MVFSARGEHYPTSGPIGPITDQSFSGSFRGEKGLDTRGNRGFQDGSAILMAGARKGEQLCVGLVPGRGRLCPGSQNLGAFCASPSGVYPLPVLGTSQPARIECNLN